MSECTKHQTLLNIAGRPSATFLRSLGDPAQRDRPPGVGGGRNSDGRDGKRTGNTGQQRSLTVNNGHSKTGHDQVDNALTRLGEHGWMRVRFPQLHAFRRICPAQGICAFVVQGRREAARCPRVLGRDDVRRCRVRESSVRGRRPDRAARDRWGPGDSDLSHRARSAPPESLLRVDTVDMGVENLERVIGVGRVLDVLG